MATKTFDELKQLAIQIRDEKTNKANTATRIGTQMIEHLNKLEQEYYNKIGTDKELRKRDEKLAELYFYKFDNTPSEGNLLDADKILKGVYVNSNGVLGENESYGVIYIPMRGKPISTNCESGGFLATTDKYGNVNHVNKENQNTSKTILFSEGDCYAMVTVPLRLIGVSAAISYGEEIPTYSVYGYFLKEEGKQLTSRVESLEPLKILSDKKYDYSTPLSIETFNKTIITEVEIHQGEYFKVSANGTAEWSRLLLMFKFSDGKEQREDSIKKGETRTVLAEKDIVRVDLFTTVTEVGDVKININREGEFTELKNEVENPTKEINGNRITNSSVGLTKLSEDIIVKPKKLFNPNDEDVKTGYYLGSNGDLVQNPTYLTSGFISFTKDMVKLQASVNGNKINGGAFSLVYDINKNKISSFINNNSGGLLNWQEGVAFARFSFNTGDINEEIQVEVGDKISGYEPYEMKISEELLPEDKNLDILRSSLGNDLDTITKDELGDSEIITLENFPWHIKKRLVMSFSASITSFSSVLIGKGLEQYRGSYIKIDAANLIHYFYESSAIEKEKVNHELKIDGFIRVSLFSDDSGYLYVILQSKDGTFKHIFKDWKYEANWKPFVKSIGSVLGDMKLNAGCQDFKLPVWAFGDSYFGVSLNRWIGAMRDFGFFNFLINGLAGQNSSAAYDDLVKCLKFGTPKYLLWCLGMNDRNDSFISTFDKVKSLCESKGVTLIGATIPTVPERDKEVISQYVRDSGGRYIDFYKAMGANVVGQWYEGYLDSDKVHPTVLGAKAQAMQVLIDFPELMQYGLTSTEGEIGNSVGDE